MIHTPSGQDLPLPQIGFPLVSKHAGIEDITQLQQYAQEDREGVVIRFQSGLMVKVKFAEYFRLHRIITGLSVLEIWKYLAEGRSLDNLLSKVPDEMYEWVKQCMRCKRNMEP